MTILTTHVGSLPRGDALAQLLLKRDHGETVDDALFEQTVQAGIDHAVQKQAEAGVGIMSDGELGKVGYATYITERLEGFGGHVDRQPAKDLADFPICARSWRTSWARRSSCGRPASVRSSCARWSLAMRTSVASSRRWRATGAARGAS
jgi:methionine synthase II (cobalamin-independent)